MAEQSGANYFTPLVGTGGFLLGQKRSQDAVPKIALGLIAQLCFTQ